MNSSYSAKGMERRAKGKKKHYQDLVVLNHKILIIASPDLSNLSALPYALC